MFCCVYITILVRYVKGNFICLVSRATFVPVVIMCHSGGARGASATKLENKGYEEIYVVTDCFEGETIKKGERKNWRLKNEAPTLLG